MSKNTTKSDRSEEAERRAREKERDLQRKAEREAKELERKETEE